MKKLFSIAMAAAMAFGLASCSKDNTLDTGGNPGSSSLSFSVKSLKGNLVTYAIADGAEWTVNDISAYVYDNGGALIGTDADFDKNGYVYTAKNTFVNSYAGQDITVYFVGNNTANVFGGTGQITAAPATEAAFIEQTTVAQQLTAGKLELLEAPLLFSKSATVTVPSTGKKEVEVKLKRREARFDIQYSDGTVPVPATFSIKKVIVKQASDRGYIFADATGAAIATKGDFADITVTADGGPFAFDADRQIKSVFYMYPSQLGGGNTTIEIVAEINGTERLFFVQSNAAVEANYRYILKFDPAVLQFSLVVADYDEGEIIDVKPSAPGLIGFAAGAGTGLLTTNSYELVAGENATLQVTAGASSAQGFDVAVSGTNGIVNAAAIAASQSVGTITYGATHFPVTFDLATVYAASVPGTEVIVTFTDKANSNNVVLVMLYDGIAETPEAESNSYMVAPGSGRIVIPVSRAYAFWNDNTNFTNAADLAADAVFTGEFLWTDVPAGMSENGAVKSFFVKGKGADAVLVVEPGTGEGNAVVAVKSGGEIKWSWHIWNTNFDLSQLPANDYGTIWMDRNLGALVNYYDAARESDVMGLIFQYGRKDPMPGFKDFNVVYPTANPYRPIYDAAGVIVTYENIDKVGMATLADGVANPGNFISVSGSTETTGNWTNENTSAVWNDPAATNTRKSLFDPCPEGWVIAKRNDYSKAERYNWSVRTDHGKINDTFGGYYPLAGLRWAGGTFSRINVYTHIWVSDVHDQYLAYSLAGAHSSNAIAGNTPTSKGRGYNIRCVKE